MSFCLLFFFQCFLLRFLCLYFYITVCIFAWSHIFILNEEGCQLQNVSWAQLLTYWLIIRVQRSIFDKMALKPRSGKNFIVFRVATKQIPCLSNKLWQLVFSWSVIDQFIVVFNRVWTKSSERLTAFRPLFAASTISLGCKTNLPPTAPIVCTMM